ncbi:MAG: hypothetical protein AB4911_24650, partial [Oscillochloridaceae bacterium umkhey_bin13]
MIALAERDPRRAGLIALHQLNLGPLDPATEVALGWALLRWERLDQAAAILARAAHGLAPNHPAQINLAHATLLLAQLQGADQALQARWQAQIETWLAQGQLRAALRARCEQIGHLNLLGQYAQAAALAATLEAPLAQVHDPALRARWLHVWGVAAAGQADLDLATERLTRAAALFRQLGQRAELARAAFELAWVAWRREQLDAAWQQLEQAQAIYQRLDMPFRVALCQRDLGAIAYLQGDYAHALALGLAARTTFEQLGRSYHVACCDLNLGAVAHVSGLYDLALAAYQHAEARFREHADQIRAVIAGRNQVLASWAMGRSAQALERISALVIEAATLSDRLEACEVQAAQARVLHGVGQTGAAIQTWQAAITQFVQLGNQPAAAEGQLELAWIDLGDGELDRAQVLLEQAAPVLAERPVHAWRIGYALGQIAERRGDLSTALHTYLAATAQVAQLRRRLASAHAASGIFWQAQALHDAALQLAARLADHAALFQLAAYQQSLSLERQRMLPPLPPASLAEQEQARNALRAALNTAAEPAQRDAAFTHYLRTLLHARHRSLLPPLTHEPFAIHDLRNQLSANYGTNWSLLCPLFTSDGLLLLGLTPETSFCT